MQLFSPERANALIPVLTPLLENLWAQRRALAIALLEADPALRPVRGAAEPREADRRARRAIEEQKTAIRQAVARIEAHGCVLKDIDLGLLDFLAVRDGQQVYLCWKAGEASVSHWHGIDENFSLRKEL